MANRSGNDSCWAPDEHIAHRVQEFDPVDVSLSEMPFHTVCTEVL